jgi:hypothetical protein
MTNIDLEIGPLSVTVWGRWYKGQNYAITPRTIQPPDPPDFTIYKVLLFNGKESIDLYNHLPEDVLSDLRDDAIDLLSQEEL